MNSKRRKTLGVTVLADFILSEGISTIVENLLRQGVTDVATNPTVTTAAKEGVGTFQPPADAGSSPRRFDRPLFGKHALWVESAPSYEPNPKFYQESAYGPRKVKPLTGQHGDVVAEFITACQTAGLRVVFQLGAAQPTGLRDEDRPHQVTGEIAKKRMADTGCLASPAIHDYNRAYLSDLLACYPTIDGIRIDWPEYPCYTMSEVLHDFSPHMGVRANAIGTSFDQLTAGMARFVSHLAGGLTERELMETTGLTIADAFCSLAGHDGEIVRDWLQLKAKVSTELVSNWQQIISDSLRPDLHLTAHAFMPPYSEVTGLDFTAVAAHCDSVSPKFYTMHWPLMVEFWTDWFLERNPALANARTSVAKVIASWMDLGTPEEIDRNVARYRYPEPHEPHPISVENQQKKLATVARLLASQPASFVPLVHGYGPLDDFVTRFSVIWNADVDGVWINRYGYLSDDKLAAVGEICRGKAS
jgi:hypothetical protein